MEIAPLAGAPRSVNTTPDMTTISVEWDPNLLATDRGTGIATRPTRDGGAAIVAAWSTQDLARDSVQKDLAKSDSYQKALVGVFAEAIARNEAALSQLTSNFAMDEKYQPGNGTFDFRLDRPGTEGDLRYVGLLDAAPAPIQDILKSAEGFRRHF